MRVSISVVGLPVKTGKRKTKRMFEPSELTRFWTFELRPLTTDEMTMTVMTPMTMPRMVSEERSLLVRRVSSAMAMVSLALSKAMVLLLV